MRPARARGKQLPSVHNGNCTSRSKDASSDQWTGDNAGPMTVSLSSPSLTSASQSPSALAPLTVMTPPTSALSTNTAHYSATCAENAHEWILAVKQLSPPSSNAPPPKAEDAVKEKRSHSGRSASILSGSNGQRSFTTVVARTPLEERIGVPELKMIMRAFEVPPDKRSVLHHKELSSESVDGGTTDPSVAPLTPVAYSLDELHPIAGGTLQSPHSAIPSGHQASGEVTGAHSPAAGRRQRRCAGPASSPFGAMPTLRKLSREEFIRAIQSAVPSATLLEIETLLAKTASEAQDAVSWSELTAFLVARTQQKADLSLENQRFVLGNPPHGMRFDDQHSSLITCVALEPMRHLIVTGCSEGTVRAWSTGNDLAYRGLLLKVNKWIVGLHWGCRQRVLYVVTMDRWVYILDGTTYGVLRVYHGRSITESSASVKYANETIGTVHVGGIALRRGKGSPACGTGGVHFTQMDPGSSSSSKASPSAHRPTSGVVSRETREERIQRLLFAAMKVHHTGCPTSKDASSTERSLRAGSGQTDVTQATMDVNASQESSSSKPKTHLPPTHTLGKFYSLSTAGAADALHQDNTPLTGIGRGPYVHQRLEEGVLTALVDPVTATAFHESAFQEDVLLLGTNAGDVFLFELARNHHLHEKQVLLTRHVFRQLHRGRVTKLDLLVSLQALVSSGADGHVHVTSLVMGQRLRSFYADDLPEQHASVTDFSLHPQLKMLLTVGPERRALVWEWTQPSPIAILNPANSPCCCGAFMGDRVLTMSQDGILHVYDCKVFSLQQELPLATAGSLDRFGGTVSATRPAISRMVVCEERQRVLCFGNFPLSLCGKWQVTSSFPERYIGPHAQIFTTLFSRAFGQVVTVGTDGIAMTWTPQTGTNEFSFPFSNFSNTTASSAPLRPTAVAMDGLQRRLLTGFAGGIMVVWCILNGRVERVLTASAERDLSLHSSSRAASRGTAKRAVKTPSNRSTHVAPASGEPLSATAAATPSPGRVVTAVGSFLRHRTTSYMFALGTHLYVDLATESAGVPLQSSSSQSGEYSTTPKSSWTVPTAFGDITQLVQIDSHFVACATASGAVLLYNVFFDRQEGAPLWVRESLLSPTWGTSGALSPAPTAFAFSDSSNIGGTSALPCRNSAVSPASAHGQGFASGGAADAPDAVPATATSGTVVSRVKRMVTLSVVHPRLLVVGQDDGTVSLWHTLRRVCLGAVNLTTAPGVHSAEDGGDSIVVMDIEETEGQLLVFGDGAGNVHVCCVEWKVLTDSHEQPIALAMPNLALYLQTPALLKETLSATETSAAGSSEDNLAAERSLPVLQQLGRVHTFASGLTLCDVRFVHTDTKASRARAAAPPPQMKTDIENDDAAPEGGIGDSAANVFLGASKDADSTRLLIVCTGVDYYVRVFTLAGVPIGEFGMDEWDTARPSTFRFMGEPTVPPAVPLPCSLPGNIRWQQEEFDTIKKSRCYHDYLADLNAVQHAPHAMHFSRSREHAYGGSAPPSSTPSQRRAAGGAVSFDSFDNSLLRAVSKFASAVRPSPAPDAFHSVDQAANVAAVDKVPLHRQTHVAASVGSGEASARSARALISEHPSRSSLLDPAPDPTSSAKHSLTPHLRRRMRNRGEADRNFGGLLKHSYTRQLRHRYLQGPVLLVPSSPHKQAALPDLNTLLSPSSTSSSASDTVPAKRRPVPQPAKDEGHGATSQHGALEPFPGPLQSVMESHNSSADVLCMLRDTPSTHTRSSPMSVCALSDAGGGIMRRRPSTASTYAPHSVGESPRNLTSQLGDSAAVASVESAVPQISPVTTMEVFPDRQALRGLSKTKRSSLLPAMQAGEPSTSSNPRNPPLPSAISASLPIVSATAHGGSRAASSSLAPARALPRNVLIKADLPFSTATIQTRSGTATGRQITRPIVSYMYSERARLLENTQTAAAREQLATLATVPPTAQVFTGSTGTSSLVAASPHSALMSKGATGKSSPSPSNSSLQALDVYDRVGSVPEKRGFRLAAPTSAAQVRTQSVRGFLAEVTSRMYVAPMEEVSKPSAGVSRWRCATATPSTSPRGSN
ncbi:hypothetical protein JKF63_02109 [Porcisia hertigi]|uniref:Guanine nucleotide-binding protein subunit beta-like protein n=1 Tax=Porcisia hertigi TaxID=2761500 RepID=A0A836ID59_9TRYP|nr:hypothetical protein JKF63_02109 [Porcisia hertigi]